ncbi:MAG: hypothetical protein KKA84_16280 [Bacteroidetes bacterium]|nr:hypothetical protein [Bacteroidota bacterium]
MSIDKKDIFIVKLKSIKSTIEKASDTQKKENIAMHLGEGFNSLISEIGQVYPDIKESLPKPFTASGPLQRLKKMDVNYLDLEITTETVMSLLNLVEN